MSAYSIKTNPTSRACSHPPGQRRTNPAAAIHGWTVALLTLCIGGYLQPVLADEVDDLTAMSLESLMDVEVTSVAKQSRKLADTAAAIHVISNEDIRRSGASSNDT